LDDDHLWDRLNTKQREEREHMWSHDFLESNTAHVQPSHPLSYDLYHYLIGMVTTWHFSRGPALGPKKKTPLFCFFFFNLIKGWKWEVRRWWSWTGGEGVEGSRELRGGVSKKETRRWFGHRDCLGEISCVGDMGFHVIRTT
jgi:hypothetical protein